ncbi:MAG: COG1361 family protein [Phycisphaerales bacterium]
MRNGKFNTATKLSVAMLMGALLAGCTQTQSTNNNNPEPVETDNVVDDSPTEWGHSHYSPDLRDNESAASMAFPTGDVNTSALLVHQVMPNEVARGQDFGFSYHITNLTNNELQNVMLMLDSSNNLEVVRSNPEGNNSGDGMTWALGELGPRQTKVIRLTGNADQVGTASDCITVSYNNFLCANTRVVEPALALSKTATAEALSCDEIVIRYLVENTGSGSASNVVIKDTLPEGLAMNNGSRSVNIPVGTLAAGESRAFEVRATASGTGEFTSDAMASADGGLEAQSDATTTVISQPELAVAVECTEMQFLGRNFTYNYSIENTGDGVANSATASASIPQGTSVVRVSNGGQVQGNNVVWNFGAMDAGASRDFSMTVSASSIGNYTSSVVANAACADSVSDSCRTEVKGIPAILLEVVDITDPVEVGQQTTYVITVTNQGSANDNNIRIVATLPPEQSFVSASGATNGTANGKTVNFAPSGSLAPGAAITWRVTVRADSAADSRFRVEMTSANLKSEVIETEATNLYE